MWGNFYAFVITLKQIPSSGTEYHFTLIKILAVNRIS